jgi:RsiW-degrading membrane proteinase PrsW (M82 family)
MDENERRMVLIGMSAIGGAIVSLWSLPWKQMAWKEIIFTLFVGTVFAIFGVPYVVADWMHVDIGPLRVACGTTFFGAAFGVPLMPLLQRKAEKLLGLNREDKL